MAKHPVPKRKSTPTRSARRYAVHVKKALDKLAKFVHLIKDPETGELVPNHMVNPSTGRFRGRQVVAQKAKKVTKLKAE